MNSDPTDQTVPASRSRAKGLGYSLAGTFCLSNNFVAAKYGLGGFNVTTFSFLWAGMAMVWALVTVFIRGRFKEIFISARLIPKLIAVGFLSGLSMILNWGGLFYLDPSFASFLRRFMPIITIVMASVILKEKFSRKELWPILLMVAGSLYSAAGRWQVVGLGMMLSILSCFAGASQQLMTKVAVKDVSPLIVTFYRGLMAAATLGLWLLVTQSGNFDVDLKFWAITALGAFLAPFAGFLLMSIAYKHWDLSKASLIFLTQPVFVMILSTIFLEKTPHVQELIGGAAIMSGAFWLNWLSFRSPGRRVDAQ